MLPVYAYSYGGGIGDMRLTMQERKALTDQVAARYRGARRADKQLMLDESV